MARKGLELKDKLSLIWKRTKKDLEAVVSETSKLIKKGEKQVKEISERSRLKLEIMNLKLKREKLYYTLGKSIAGTSPSKWSQNKKIEKIIAEIKKLNREITKKEKQVKNI
ncbi:MAG TPA: hypothetical protein ENF60_02315 [Candidatus Omnitrophica bacterium]|nr:hypothetical protein [Candidatus Omnitrophota bacterium]